LFPVAHPSIVQLAEVLRKQEASYSLRIRGILVGIETLEEEGEYFFPSCDEFRDWNSQQQNQQNHQQRPIRETEEVYYDANGEYAGIANYASNHTEIEEILAELSYENADTGSKERRRCGLCRQKGHNKKTCKINLEVERQ
jgi:hypothetical protein